MREFRAPKVEEVAAYCRERANAVDAGRFVDYYTANGWKVGRAPMKDWQAAVRTWEKNQAAQTRKGPRPLTDEEIKNGKYSGTTGYSRAE